MKHELSVFDKHQLRIARDTLKMSDIGARVMGGPTKDEAREIIYRITGIRPKSEASFKNPSRVQQSGDAVAAHELSLFAINDAELYRQQTQPIILNLQRKIKRGVYDPALALKLWTYLADSAAKKYSFEFGERKYGARMERDSWEIGDWRKRKGYGVFSVSTRKLAATEIAAHYESAVSETPFKRSTTEQKRIDDYYKNPSRPNPAHLKAQARFYGKNPLPYPKHIKRQTPGYDGINRPVFRFEIKTATGWQKVQGTVRSKLAAKRTAMKIAAHYRKPVKVFSSAA